MIMIITLVIIVVKQMKKKRHLQKQMKEKKTLWRELLDFWPLSIIIPSMLILILLGSAGVF